MQTNNHDVKALNDALNRYVTELLRSQSSNVSVLSQADRERVRSYLDHVDALRVHIQAQPELDLPETAPQLYQLRDDPEVPDVENEALNHVANLLLVARDELRDSQSSRLPAGLLPFDGERLQAIVAKARAFIEDATVTGTAMDLPESSPRAVTSGPGRRGIGGPGG